jgi:hypothetical protein
VFVADPIQNKIYELGFQTFHRGDENADDFIDIGDVLGLLTFLFLGAGELTGLDAADSNNDSIVDMTDAIEVARFLFLGGSSLPPSVSPFSIIVLVLLLISCFYFHFHV